MNCKMAEKRSPGGSESFYQEKKQPLDSHTNTGHGTKLENIRNSFERWIQRMDNNMTQTKSAVSLINEFHKGKVEETNIEELFDDDVDWEYSHDKKDRTDEVSDESYIAPTKGKRRYESVERSANKRPRNRHPEVSTSDVEDDEYIAQEPVRPARSSSAVTKRQARMTAISDRIRKTVNPQPELDRPATCADLKALESVLNKRFTNLENTIQAMRMELKRFMKERRPEKTEVRVERLVPRPLATKAEVDALDKRLGDDDRYAEAMIEYLATLGGDTPARLTVNIMTKLLAPEAAVSFNFRGTDKKVSFVAYNLHAIVEDAVQIAFPEGTEDRKVVVNKVIKDFLRNAKKKVDRKNQNRERNEMRHALALKRAERIDKATLSGRGITLSDMDDGD